ncbi:flagellar hook-length control protein FliK [Marinobacter salinexigens]|uniref:Flagellar hook-length control protein FliK n=1 Tax=Marinobacter salinexigens TaxID=2919747 RepID=A0A5B0VMT9_9GAMM|nr:flagellar hook-length control protein FliK [Marinobacter salinexigens]KAA1175199.1 flagellar hook-length control protein FliK [Marinobacter salinexigens]
MKLPGSQPPPQPSPSSRSTPPGSGDTASPARESVGLSARQQLDALQLSNRETALARVTQVIQQQGNGASELLLDVRGKSLLVQAATGKTEISAGDWVKIMRAGNELQLIGKLGLAREAGIAQALAQRMPWQHNLQAGLANLLTSLGQGLKPELAPGQLPSTVQPQPLPEAARQAIAQVLSRLPTSSSLSPGSGSHESTPGQVKQWLSESGLFAESRLTQAPSASLPDLKLAITRMITALLAQQNKGPEAFNRLTPLTSSDLVQAPLQFPQAMANTQTASAGSEPTTVAQTLRLLAGMLNRITVNQLHSQVLSARVGGDAGPAPASTLLIELPWLTPQNEPRTAQLRIEQHDRDTGRGRSTPRAARSEWRLSLAMDLDSAGQLHFDVSLRQQNVSARVWAERQETLRQVNEELPLLRRSLTDLGLEVTDLECRRGRPQGAPTRLEHRLVDTKA